MIQELAPLFAALEGNLRAIGNKLFESRAVLGIGGVASVIRVCHMRWGVPHALLRTWYRVASGELPEELVTGTKIQKTTLQHMPADVAAELAGDEEYWVASAALGRKVRKQVSAMTPDECARHITPQGYVPLADAHGASLPYQRLRASSIGIDSEKKLILITVERARITVFASADSLQNALEQLVARDEV